MDKPDVVIIGAGIGGLITGAILAKIDGMKVLMLEKESTIGDRIMSFGGPHGDYSADEYRRLLRGAAWSWVAKAEPKLSEIIDKGLFRDHINTEFPKANHILDKLPGREIDGGPAYFGFEQTSAIDPSRVLKGKGHIIQTWTCVSGRDPNEVHNKKLVNKLCEAQLAFLRNQYPKFEDMLEWYILVACDRLCDAATPGTMGNRRPGVKHPLVRNLYFTGDTVTQWDTGTSGTAHGALICAGAVDGKDHLKLLPPYLR